MTRTEKITIRETRGNFRIPYDVKNEGIEITCPVCGLYSAGKRLKERYGSVAKISLEALKKEPYVCRCGTVIRVGISEKDWYLFIIIPEYLLNKKILKKIKEEETREVIRDVVE